VIALMAAFVIAMGVTWMTTPWVAKLAVRFGAVAVPRERDVHEEHTPKWGGIAIYIGVVVAAVVGITARHIISGDKFGWNAHLVGILIAGTFIAAYGLLDDLKDLRAIWQILGILIAGGILIAFGVRIEGLTNPLVTNRPGLYDPNQWFALSLPVSAFLTLAWVFVVTKTVDAIDGLDGLAAGVCAISAATLALLAAASGYRNPEGPALAIFAASVVGGCVGFLRYNYSPARIFMSTVGAQFLGLTLAGLSILGTFKIAAAISVAVPLLVLGVPIFDYFIVIAKRLRHRAPLTAADNRHFHHRLLERGLSKKQAVWVIYGCTVILCVAAVVIFNVSR
jgi:UDP-GlcNAc:undecaprenyl-phosphate/decaprenyl-phosphate GlcNAc-1-phosphate transferase